MLLERNEAHQDLPKFLVLENVLSLEAKRHRKNFNNWKERLETLGYVNHTNRLYTLDFEVPQHRKRLIMLSVYVGNDINKKKFVEDYLRKHDLNSSYYLKSLNIKQGNLKDYLRLNYSSPKYLYEALLSQLNATDSRKTIWEKNSKIIDENGTMKDMVQTITTKQDRHPNSGNIYFNYNNGKLKYRFLTPRECFLY